MRVGGRPVPQRALLAGIATAAAIVAVYVALAAIAGLDDAWRHVREVETTWLLVGVACAAASLSGYVVLLRAVFGGHVRWRDGVQITLAGVAAARLLATAGVGGVALTAWALRRLGLERSAIAAGITTFLVLQYAVFMLALLGAGLGLYAGILGGDVPPALAITGAAVGAGALTVMAVLSAMSGRLQRLFEEATHSGRLAAAACAIASGLGGAWSLARSAQPGLLGAVAWWGFDIAVLWAVFQAFDEPPGPGVLVLSYLLGTIGNVVPLPGGLGSVEGAMIGSLVLSGVDAELAVASVLTYRTLAFWLPTVPGLVSLGTLRRRLDP